MAGLGWLRVVIDLLWRESAAGGGFLAQVQACGGGGGGGRGLKVNWLCELLCMSKEERRRKTQNRHRLSHLAGKKTARQTYQDFRII